MYWCWAQYTVTHYIHNTHCIGKQLYYSHNIGWDYLNGLQSRFSANEMLFHKQWLILLCSSLIVFKKETEKWQMLGTYSIQSLQFWDIYLVITKFKKKHVENRNCEKSRENKAGRPGLLLQRTLTSTSKFSHHFA